MNVSLTLEEVKQYAENSGYSILPLSTELLCDDVTPMEVLRRLRKISAHCYLLESVSGPEAHGRYTFLGYDPKVRISCRNGKLKIGDVALETDDPAEYLWQMLKTYRSPKLADLPP
ncbi:MAG: anthranilate synthase component I, partial [Oscillospiraceae bacterium]|nr:anthranilate synthase component I [Oscillospiraceae bacterium]